MLTKLMIFFPSSLQRGALRRSSIRTVMYLVLSAARRPLLLHKPTHTELKCLRPGCRRRKILESLQRLEPLHPSHLKVYFTITDKRKSKLWLIGPRLHQLCPRSGAGAKNVTAKHLMWTSLERSKKTTVTLGQKLNISLYP